MEMKIIFIPVQDTKKDGPSPLPETDGCSVEQCLQIFRLCCEKTTEGGFDTLDSSKPGSTIFVKKHGNFFVMTKSRMILGLDIGSNSIGWSLVKDATGGEDPVPPMVMGVRVFPEGVDRDQTGGEVSRNEARRIARGMRRQVNRRARRKARLKQALIHAGLFPADAGSQKILLDSTDPYSLRKKALEEPLTPHEIGRVLIHLNQHRGFLSNRKADAGSKDSSETLAKISALADEIGDRTLGEFFAEMRSDPNLRIRGRHTRRSMYLSEFEKIWEAQRSFHPDLMTDTLKYGSQGLVKYPVEPESHKKSETVLQKFGIHGLIFNQRPMYWPSWVIGRCELEPKEKRVPRAHRSFQRFRILQEVNNLRIIAQNGDVRPLTDTQRKQLIQLLYTSKEATFIKIRKLLGLYDGDMFNLERSDRKKLDGHKTDAYFAQSKLFGKAWYNLDENLKNEVVDALLKDDEPQILEKAQSRWGCSPDLAETLSHCSLPDGYASFSLKAIEKLLPFMEKGLILMANDNSDSALHAAGYLRRDQKVVNPRKYLPKTPDDITNPLVRQALREVRKLINTIIREFGRPDAIHIELAREIQGNAEQRSKSIKKMRENEARRSAAKAKIEGLGYKPTREAVTRYILWEDQKEHCLYSGKHISPVQLFSDRGEIDIDHILPYPRSLDDSQANRVVCFRSENQDKGDRTPYEWLALSNPQKFEAIRQRANAMPLHCRFGKTSRIDQKDVVIDEFINRQLTDTAYISRKVHEFVRQLGVDVVCVKGRHTSELRNLWGLNTVLRDDGLNLKNRDDHRHHAVDALVIAMTSRKTLQSLAWYWKLRSEYARDALRQSLLERFSGFRDKVEEVVNLIVVSHKPRRKAAGQLHEDTIYGPTHKPEKANPGPRGHAKNWVEQEGTFVRTKKLIELTLAEVLKIRDPQVRELVCNRLRQHGIDPESKGKIPPSVWTEPLYMTGKRGPEKSPNAPVIKKVRITKKDQTICPIRDGKAWVKPGKIHHVVIFETIGKKGKLARAYEFVSLLEATQRVRERKPVISRIHPKKPDAKFLFSLSVGEAVQATIKNQENIFVYRKSTSTESRLYFVAHNDARPASLDPYVEANSNDQIRKKVFIDILGRIRDASD